MGKFADEILKAAKDKLPFEYGSNREFPASAYGIALAQEAFEPVARRTVTRILHRCLKCGKEWFPRDSNPNPIRCPDCKCKHWNNPAKQYKRKIA